MLHLGPLERPGRNHTVVPAPDWPARFRMLATQARDPRLKAYYAAGVVSGDTAIAATPLMALDIETTGLDPSRDGIVSIGLVPLSLDCVRASGSRHWILKPDVPLADKSVAIHGITDSQVAHAPDLIAVLDDVLAAIAGQVLVVHCRAIERRFLAAAFVTRIGEAIEFPVIDTMELEARLYRPKPPGLLSRLLGRKPQSIRLADCRARYQLPRYRSHHAPTDALASAELLQAQVAHRFSPETPVRELWR